MTFFLNVAKMQPANSGSIALFQILCLSNDFLCIPDKIFSVISQGYAAVGAVKQCNPQILFYFFCGCKDAILRKIALLANLTKQSNPYKIYLYFVWICVLLEGDMDFISVREVASKWEISERRVQRFCEDGVLKV